MFLAFLFALVNAVATVQQPADAPALQFSAPRAVSEVDLGKLKGEASRLSWGGPTGQLYLRTAELDRWGNERPKHFLLPLAGGAPVPASEEPPQASAYWAWKSGVVAPGAPDLRFDIQSKQENKTATGTDRGSSDLGASPNRSDPSSSAIQADALSMQRVQTTTLRLKGEVILEVVNQPLRPGHTFSWAPAPLGRLAFADGKKRLCVLGRDGKKVEVAGTSEVILPAWSPDGKQIAYLQRKDKKKYTLMVVDVQ